MSSILERFVGSYTPERTLTEADYSVLGLETDRYVMRTGLKLLEMNPGSVQLVRALVSQGKESEQAAETIKHVEAICKGEPMIGMELYPQDVDKGNLAVLIMNLLRGRYSYGDKASVQDGVKINLRPLPTYHPLFAGLLDELSHHIPQHDVTPYMLCIGKKMGAYSYALLSAWLLSHPEVIAVSDTMERTKGDLNFPGIYFGQRIERTPHTLTNEWRLGGIGTQTNLYCGLMHTELPDSREFIHMAGVLGKAHSTTRGIRKRRPHFDAFTKAFGNTLKEVGLKPKRYLHMPIIKFWDVYHSNEDIHLPWIAEAARSLGPDRADHIRTSVQNSIVSIQRALYTREELDVINRVYVGEL